MSDVAADNTETRPFVHLRVRSEYSMSAGLAHVDDLARAAAQRGIPALALTDQANLSGYLKFYSACMEAGVKPIAGVDVPYRCDMGAEGDGEIVHCLLLAMNADGYQNLLKVIFGLRLDTETGARLASRDEIFANANGLIALSGGAEGEIGKALLRDDIPLAQSRLDEWIGQFRDRFYLEVMRCGREADARIEGALVDLASKHSVPLVATNEVMFAGIEDNDYEIHEIRICVQEKHIIDDPSRERRYTEDMWLKSGEDMAALFVDMPEALRNSVEIAKRCNLPMKFFQHAFPNYPDAEGESLDAHLTRLSEMKLEERLQAFGKDCEVGEDVRETYRARLKTELDVICSMEYSGYFLVVMSIIRWAKDEGIPVGPGRGSGAGSLVAWLLGITGLDPIEHGLLFERFLNTERISLPDFDIDICMERRDQVLQHIAERFGRESVGQIVTFGTMGAKAVVRDVARAKGKPFRMGDTLARLIPNQLDIKLNDAVEGQPELRRLIEEEPEYAEIMDAAYRLEGVVRNEGKHAAGLVIAPSELSRYLPVTVNEGGEAVTQFDWKDVEKAGLIKFDFLGLRTLTVIDHAVRSVNENHGLAIDIDGIPLDDGRTYRLLQEARTKGIFQLESDGLRRYILQIKPKDLADLTALLALYRPGPLQSGMVDDFIAVREGRQQPEYLHPAMREVIEPTSGVILFQEQVMRLAQVLAGFSLGQADVLRAAMGKKKQEIMDQQRSLFVDGAVENGVTRPVAEKVFDLMDKFAGYGFNRSHSTAYALISYQTAWLKANYPAEFMAAMLSSELHGSSSRDAIHRLLPEVTALGLDCLAPDVNESEFNFRAEGKGVRYGLGGIKDVGRPLIEQIVRVRQSGRYESLSDFAMRVGAKHLPEAALQQLIHAGALDMLLEGPMNETRAKMRHMAKDLLQWVSQSEQRRVAGVVDMFDDGTELPTLGVPDCPPLSDLARLELENQALGLYLTDHPMNVYKRECGLLFAGEERPQSVSVSAGRGYAAVSYAGIVTRINHRGREGGETWARIENGIDHAEAQFYDKVLEAEREKIKEGTYLLIEGSKRIDATPGFGARIRVSRAYTIAEARDKFARAINLDINGGRTLDALRGTFDALCENGSARNCRVLIHYDNGEARASLSLDRRYSILPSDENLSALREAFGEDAVQLSYRN
ncbi:MAG: DNA polymerase III subunit alpha [Gammaproteobacteria bacterium]|nr:DNA polymerase III subunit alpha [Gammaproteobacteria bacterium]